MGIVVVVDGVLVGVSCVVPLDGDDDVVVGGGIFVVIIDLVGGEDLLVVMMSLLLLVVVVVTAVECCFLLLMMMQIMLQMHRPPLPREVSSEIGRYCISTMIMIIHFHPGDGFVFDLTW